MFAGVPAVGRLSRPRRVVQRGARQRSDIAAVADPVSCTVKVKLVAGQSVDFVLGPGASSNDIEDATDFDAVVTTGK